MQKGKNARPPSQEAGGGSSTISSKHFGDHVTVDHLITRDLKDHGFEDQRVALVVKDVYSQFRYTYPSDTKSTEQCYEDLLHFFGEGR